MTQITKEQAIEMAREVAAKNGDTLKDTPEKETVELLHGLCNAAIDWAAKQGEARVNALESLLQDSLDDYLTHAEGGEADEWVIACRAALAPGAAPKENKHDRSN